ncbi:MAG: hypothetical protein ACREQE_07385 [Candidatus Binataceae bacterium]
MALSADQTNQFPYVPNLQNGTVSQYLIDANKHALTPIRNGSLDTETRRIPIVVRSRRPLRRSARVRVRVKPAYQGAAAHHPATP